MKRREFIGIIGAAAASPLVARTQQPWPVIGCLHVGYFRTLSANKPCGRIIRIATMASSVRTLAIDPDMKNSMVDCACEIVKADAMVLSRLAAPPMLRTKPVAMFA